MIGSGGVILKRLSNHVVNNLLLQNVKNNTQKQVVRYGGHSTQYFYRKKPVPSPSDVRYGVVLGGIFWWWMVWSWLTKYHMLFEPQLPDPSKWTDEELGIPPDDAD